MERQQRVTQRPIWCFREADQAAADDLVTVEEPLEIRVDETPIAVVMRTPRHDFELAAGFLSTEGLIQAPQELGAISYCPAATPPNEENIVEVKLAAGVSFDRQRLQRNFYASSSCGVCGKASLEAIACEAPALTESFTVPLAVLYGLGDRGVLAPGKKGDANVIDYQNLRLARPEARHDLPTGAMRLVQEAQGYEATIVSGEVISRHGRETGARPGQLIRGAR